MEELTKQQNALIETINVVNHHMIDAIHRGETGIARVYDITRQTLNVLSHEIAGFIEAENVVNAIKMKQGLEL